MIMTLPLPLSYIPFLTPTLLFSFSLPILPSESISPLPLLCRHLSPFSHLSSLIVPAYLHLTTSSLGHLQCLKLLTSHPQYIPNEQTVHGATAVYFAAQEGW